MTAYCIVETDDGLSIIERVEGMTAEEIAGQLGGNLIDPGPYESFEDADDALVALQGELSEDETSDVPEEQVLEGRYETGD